MVYKLAADDASSARPCSLGKTLEELVRCSYFRVNVHKPRSNFPYAVQEGIFASGELFPRSGKKSFKTLEEMEKSQLGRTYLTSDNHADVEKQIRIDERNK